MKFIIFLCSTLLYSQLCMCDIAPTWDSCKCSWNHWKEWSSCTATCGGGQQQRSRSVQNICGNFTLCASNDMGWQYKSCGTECFNGEYMLDFFPKYLGYCSCVKGWTGKCCDQAVTCGTPSTISNGVFIGNLFTYNNNVTYKCKPGFNMTDLSMASMVCTEHGYWSGVLPHCSYAISCTSNPCGNDATCTNLLEDYTCTCKKGWTGKNCDFDIQPPVVSGCPDHRFIYTENITSYQIWTEPVFTDPFGKKVIVSKNYETSSFTFPWGEYTVHYSAVKPNNSMTAECTFNISIKPFPCADLDVPKNGYLVCNGWKTDYAMVCKLMCFVGYSYPPGYKVDDWYTCGSSGNWLPSTVLTTCVSDDVSFLHSHTDDTGASIYNCSQNNLQVTVGDYYIHSLKRSQFNELCERNSDVCYQSNVNITCDNF